MKRDDTVKVLQKGDWWDAPRQFERLTLTLPADILPGESSRLIIEARDQFGFTLKDFSGDMQLQQRDSRRGDRHGHHQRGGNRPLQRNSAYRASRCDGGRGTLRG
ncbi:MAG: hypothetical protein ACLFWB_11895 [Armatimonadota bacterium]